MLDTLKPQPPNTRVMYVSGMFIADAAKGSSSWALRPSCLISCGEAEQYRKVRRWLRGSSVACVDRGSSAGQSLLETGEGRNRKGRRRDGWGGGEGQVFMVVEKAARLG